MATAHDLAGADRKGVEFRSVLPRLTGESGGLAAVHGACLILRRAMIHDSWKLILYPAANVAKLYHLTDDPQEMQNLAASPAMTGRKKSLFAKLRELQNDCNDKLDLEPVFYRT